MTDNWYIVLELAFDPTPEHDERVIAKQIEEKRAFWSRRFNDPTKGAAYHRYLDRVHDGTIVKDMIGPHNKRKQLIKEACEITYGPIDETLRLTGLGGKVTGDELQRIADHHRVNIDVVRRQALALGIQIGEGKQENYQALYHKYYSHKSDNAAVFDQMSQYFISFSVDNLYEFLSDNTPDAGLKRSSCDDLRKRAEEKRKKEFYRNDARSTAGQRLCGYCESAFKDTRSKAVYDSYLLHTRTKTLLNKVKNQYTISGRLSEELSEKFVADLTEVLKERKLATEVLVAFCEVERIPYTLPRSPSSGSSPSGDSPAGGFSSSSSSSSPPRRSPSRSSPTGSSKSGKPPVGSSPSGSSPSNSSPAGDFSSNSSSVGNSPSGGSPAGSSPTGSSPSGSSPSRSSPAGGSALGSSPLIYPILILAAFILAIIFFVPLMNDDGRHSGAGPTQAAKQTLEITEKMVSDEKLLSFYIISGFENFAPIYADLREDFRTSNYARMEINVQKLAQAVDNERARFGKRHSGKSDFEVTLSGAEMIVFKRYEKYLDLMESLAAAVKYPLSWDDPMEKSNGVAAAFVQSNKLTSQLNSLLNDCKEFNVKCGEESSDVKELRKRIPSF